MARHCGYVPRNMRGRGSAYEVKNPLLYARDVGYVEPACFEELVDDRDRIVRDLNKVITKIRDRLTNTSSGR